MKKRLVSSFAALTVALTASAAVEPLAVLRVPSIEKLGSAATQLCGAAGQPMLGGMGMGMLQQYIQGAIGPFDPARPVAVVIYADPAKLDAALSSTGAAGPAGALPEIKAGLILPIASSGETFARDKQLTLNAEGVARLPGTPMFITFKERNACLASDEQTALRLKVETAHYQTAPAHGDALAIEFFPPAISLYGNISEKQSRETKRLAQGPMQQMLLLSFAENQKQLAQLASFTIGLGYHPERGLVIGTDTRYKPGSELASFAAAAKPVKAGLLANVPDKAQFCQLLSFSSPGIAARLNSQANLAQALQVVLDAALGKKYPDLSKAFAGSIATLSKLAGKCDQYLASGGYDKASRLWAYSRVAALPGQRDAVFQSVLDENRNLSAALESSFPGKKFLTFDAASATWTCDLAKLPVNEIYEAAKDGKKIKEKERAELEKTVRTLADVLTGGQPIRTKYVKTADGYEAVTSCDGVANLPKSSGNGKMAELAKAAENTAQFCYFDLFSLARNVLEERIPKVEEGEKKLAESILAALPAGGPDGALSVREKIRDGVSRCEIALPPGALQKGAALFTAIKDAEAGGDGDKNP